MIQVLGVLSPFVVERGVVSNESNERQGLPGDGSGTLQVTTRALELYRCL